MSFKCPNCKKDFGNNQKALYNHFEKNSKCKNLAILLLKKIGVD